MANSNRRHKAASIAERKEKKDIKAVESHDLQCPLGTWHMEKERDWQKSK